MQLAIFPGWKTPAPSIGEEKPRLDVVVVIKIKDNKTGEKFTREIHQDFSDGSLVYDSILGAVDHQITTNEVKRFCSGRSGFPESIKDDEKTGGTSITFSRGTGVKDRRRGEEDI